MRVVLILSTLLMSGLSNGPPNLQREETTVNSENFLQPADFALAEKMPVTIPTNAELDAIINTRLFEGDIDGIPAGAQTSPVLRSRRSEPALTENNVILRSSINLASFPNGLWPQGRVPYVMEPGMNTQQRTAIAQAVDEFNRLTCIRIVPREARDTAFVFLRRTGAAGCSSFIGRTGGNQTVNLALGCYTKGIVVHELMHAIGFFHEQSRPDRDRFVRIAFENIRPETRHNFAMHNARIIDAQGMPYDYGSLMHYHRTAFSINGRDTIVPTNPNAPIGNRSGMSATDAAKINLLYKCPRR